MIIDFSSFSPSSCLLHLIVLLLSARKGDLLAEASKLFPAVFGTAKWGWQRVCRRADLLAALLPPSAAAPRACAHPRGGPRGWGGRLAETRWRQSPSPSLPPRPIFHPGCPSPSSPTASPPSAAPLPGSWTPGLSDSSSTSSSRPSKLRPTV